MSPLSKTEERYRNDDTFHAMVDTMRAVIENLQLTPSEVREAAMYACYLTETRRGPSHFVTADPDRSEDR